MVAWLVMLQHCSSCRAAPGDCPAKTDCYIGKKLLQHIRVHGGKVPQTCDYPCCQQTMQLLSHYAACKVGEPGSASECWLSPADLLVPVWLACGVPYPPPVCERWEATHAHPALWAGPGLHKTVLQRISKGFEHSGMQGFGRGLAPSLREFLPGTTHAVAPAVAAGCAAAPRLTYTDSCAPSVCLPCSPSRRAPCAARYRCTCVRARQRISWHNNIARSWARRPAGLRRGATPGTKRASYTP